ncbi:MAG: flavodoxin family protein [Desulfarculaceae bacterium]|nr:flavodoxin family protein [Desulfarculaceae bacterium]MCF8049048.1 flavodoxin family protein [Desulfarculaceae bacterium]MCF8064988.1 flavodoxin family protein [Desulfarculaceae bacterium]MCF8097544.1 flavodoxin family protein [Desulfarculaceae bacterium]MCF8122209.1 flavodoxin family protein [Desulfarculaceae bacterium]
MSRIVAIYGSPRQGGNSALLTDQAVEGAKEAGATVEKLVLRDLNISPCLEIYGCKKDGRCVIKDDFQGLYDQCLAADAMILSSPIFFYTVSAHTKIMMDRFQSLWVKKYWIDKVKFGQWTPKRKGLFISVGATHGQKLFEGVLLTVRYFMDVLDMELSQSLLYRGLDLKGDVEQHPEYLQEAREAGAALAADLQQLKP